MFYTKNSKPGPGSQANCRLKILGKFRVEACIAPKYWATTKEEDTSGSMSIFATEEDQNDTKKAIVTFEYKMKGTAYTVTPTIVNADYELVEIACANKILNEELTREATESAVKGLFISNNSTDGIMIDSNQSMWNTDNTRKVLIQKSLVPTSNATKIAIALGIAAGIAIIVLILWCK